jgi:echinoid
MRPTGSKGAERVGNTTVAVLIRHRPGKAVITPNHPVVHVGSGVTLKCSANPPGWPIPQYRWFRDVEGDLSTQTVLAQGSEFVIPRAHLGSEGRYHCHAANEMGHGEMATITLEVHQPPQFLAKLQQHLTKRVGDSDFSVSCSAKGKPKPLVKWFKDGRELTGEMNYYEISTSPNEGPNGMVTVQSNLKHGNQLMSGDRGTYSCVYANEVNTNNSTMNLKIEHEPIVLHKFNKVAADLRESVEIMCKVQAYPKPEFQWTFGTNTALIQSSLESHYEISSTVDGNDVYTSILKVANVGKSDYGDYYCRASNSLETIRTGIRLQPKGAPEKPTDLDASEIGHNFISLNWTPGFDGGVLKTKYFVHYRKVSIPSNEINGDCDSHYVTSSEWSEFDCHTDYPCNITPLDQHSSYVFKVKALNTKGSSEFSNEVTRTTKVSRVPKALQVTFDPMTKILGVDVGTTCLALIAVVESIVQDDTYKSEWRIVKQIPLHASGSSATHEKSVVENIQMPRSRNAARSLEHIEEEDFTMALEDDPMPSVRVKLCLKGNPEYCGDYTIAESEFIFP